MMIMAYFPDLKETENECGNRTVHSQVDATFTSRSLDPLHCVTLR